MKISHEKLQISISQRKQKSNFSGNSQTVLTDFLQLLKDYHKLRWADAHYGRWGIENNFQ